MVRTVQQWKQILVGKHHIEVAKHVLGDLTHYRHGGSYEDNDLQQLANALEAFHELRSGITK